jgi:hypothetical protein
MNVNVKVVSRLWSAFLYMLRLGITFSTWMGTLFFFWSLMSSPLDSYSCPSSSCFKEFFTCSATN